MNSYCTNTIGSYGCVCKHGLRFSSEKRACVDIDECAENIHYCKDSSNCRNKLGGYECECPKGFIWSNEAMECIDVDECEVTKDLSSERFIEYNSCDDHAKCTNTIGSFVCECDPGWKLNKDFFCEGLILFN